MAKSIIYQVLVTDITTKSERVIDIVEEFDSDKNYTVSDYLNYLTLRPDNVDVDIRELSTLKIVKVDECSSSCANTYF